MSARRLLAGLAFLLASTATTSAEPTEVPVAAEASRNEHVRFLIDQYRGNDPGRNVVYVTPLRDTRGAFLEAFSGYSEFAETSIREALRLVPATLGQGNSLAVVETRAGVSLGYGALDVRVEGTETNHRFSFPGFNDRLRVGATPAMVEVGQAFAEGRRSVRVMAEGVYAEDIRADIEARRTILVANFAPATNSVNGGIFHLESTLSMSEERFRAQIESGREADRKFLAERGLTVPNQERVGENERWREALTQLREAHRAGLVVFWSAPAHIPGGGPQASVPGKLAEAIADALRQSEPGPAPRPGVLPRGRGTSPPVARGPLVRQATEIVRSRTWGQNDGKGLGILSRIRPRAR